MYRLHEMLRDGALLPRRCGPGDSRPVGRVRCHHTRLTRLLQRSDGTDTLLLPASVLLQGGRNDRQVWRIVVSCRRGGASVTFEQLNQFFTISNTPVVSSQYWNSVHGFTPDDVRRDRERLQTMRTLGENMVWLLKGMKAARRQGIGKPEYELRENTHFIQNH